MHLLRDLALSLSFDRVQESEINRSRPTLNSALMHCRVFFFFTGCIPGCKNGGRCVAGTACKCPTFFYGAQCERFSLRDLISRPRAWARTTPGKVRRIIITKPGRQFTDQMVRRAQNPNFYKNKEVVLNQDLFPPEKDTSVKRQEIEIVPSSKRSEEALPEEKPLILEI